MDAPPAEILTFIDHLPVTIREALAAGVVSMFDECALHPEKSSVQWIHDYLAPQPGYQPGHRAILVCAAIDHVSQRQHVTAEFLEQAWKGDTSRTAKALIARAPMAAAHWEQAAALWQERRRSVLAPERLREYVRSPQG